MEYLFSSELGVLLPAIRKDIPMGSPEAGWLGSARALSRMLMLPASPLLVRYRPKRALAVILGVVAILLAAVSQASSFPFLFVALFVYAAFAGFSQVPTQLLRFQWIPQRELATVLGIGLGVSATVQSLGLMVIPQLLERSVHWRQVALAIGGIVLLLAIFWVLAGRERDTPRYRRGMAGSTGLGALRGALRRQELVLLGLAMMGGTTAYLTTLLFLPVYLVDERGLALTTAGMVSSLAPLGGMAASFSAGFISDLVGRRKPLIWPSGVVLPLLYLILLSLDHPQALALASFALGYAAYAPFPVLQTIPFELPGIRPSEVAVGQSLMQAIATFGQTVGPVITGYVAQAMGSLRAGLLALSLLPLLFIVVGLILPETGPKGSPRSSS